MSGFLTARRRSTFCLGLRHDGGGAICRDLRLDRRHGPVEMGDGDAVGHRRGRPLSVAPGLALVTLAWRSRLGERILNPILNIAQSLPHFAYLIPVVVFIGVGSKTGAVVTLIFSVPPVICMTLLGLRNIPPEMVESAQMSGAGPAPPLWHVKLPLAVPTLVVGANQSIMFSLFMVIVAAFVGTRDLGQEMQRALSSTDVGKGLVLGLAVAFMGPIADHLLTRMARGQNRDRNPG